MVNKDWLQDPADQELQAQAREKITKLQLFEEEVPAIFIIHDVIHSSVVYMSKRGLDELGVTLDDIRLHHIDYHAKFFNPVDAETYVPKIIGLIERNKTDEIISYFQQVRKSPNLPWNWYMSSTKVFLRDKAGKPRLIITLAMPVETIHPITTKVEKLLEENAFLKKNYHLFITLTKREKQILALMAKGANSNEMAAQLNMSEATANTHRRNIRRKLNIQTNYDILRFAQAFDLI